jgi:hypothetical protein
VVAPAGVAALLGGVVVVGSVLCGVGGDHGAPYLCAAHRAGPAM